MPRVISEKKAVYVEIEKDLDHHYATKIKKGVDLKIKSSACKNVIFDFTMVDFMDSSGIGLIMGRYKMTKILGGKVVIFGLKKTADRIIKMSGIDKLVEVCDSFDEAIKKL